MVDEARIMNTMAKMALHLQTHESICSECYNRFGVAIYGLFDIEINKLVETYSVKWEENDK